LVRADQRQPLELLPVVQRRLAAVEDLEADGVGLAFHQPLELVRLGQRDVAPVRVLLVVVAVAHDRILRELEEIAAEKTEAALDGDLNHAQRRHHPDDREDADSHAEHRQERPQLVRAERSHGHADDLAAAHYSYLNASIGSRRDALTAGARPEKMPVTAETISPTTIRVMENCIGNFGMAAATAMEMPQQSRMPTRPPMRQIDTASIRNCSRIVRRRAPRALRVPISRVRSFTLT